MNGTTDYIKRAAQCIGIDLNTFEMPIMRQYRADRNILISVNGSSENEDWETMWGAGYAQKEGEVGDFRIWSMTDDGLQWLGTALGIKIVIA